MTFQARLESNSLVDGEIGKDLFFGLTFTKDFTFQKDRRSASVVILHFVCSCVLLHDTPTSFFLLII